MQKVIVATLAIMILSGCSVRKEMVPMGEVKPMVQ